MQSTESEGARECPTTHWSLIYLASQADREAGLKALDGLLRTYERPLLVHLRAKFRVPEDQARDWFQGFAEKKVLGNRLLEKADEAKGKFRTFVLNALDNFVADEFDRQNSLKRKPPGGVVTLEEAPEADAVAAAEQPAHSTDYEWAWTVVDRAKERGRAFYETQGTPRTWAAFCEGALAWRAERPSNVELAQRHGFESAKQVEGAITTAQRQFGKQLRAVVAEYVQDESQIEDEIHDLIAILAGSG